MFSNIRLDKALATKAEGESSSVITNSGAYVGKFTQVYGTDSPKTGSRASFINFSFVSDSGQTANIRLNVTKADGSDSFGMGIFHAVMTVFKLREIHGSKGYVTDRFGQTVEAVIFHEMVNKPIGVLLQREEYEYTKDGEDKIGWNMTLQMPFDAVTRQSAKEILQGLPAHRLDERLPYVKDKVALSTAKAEFENAYRRSTDELPADKNPKYDNPDDEDVPF